MNLSPCTCVQPKSVSRPSRHACQFGTAHPREPLRLEQLSACCPFWKMTSNLVDFMLLLSCSFCKQPTKHKHCFPRRGPQPHTKWRFSDRVREFPSTFKVTKSSLFPYLSKFFELLFQLTMASINHIVMAQGPQAGGLGGRGRRGGYARGSFTLCVERSIAAQIAV